MGIEVMPENSPGCILPACAKPLPGPSAPPHQDSELLGQPEEEMWLLAVPRGAAPVVERVLRG